jgi:hypothetical protein
VLAGADRCAYRIEPAVPFAFCEYVCVIPLGSWPEDPVESSMWRTSPHLGPLLLATVCAMMIFSPAWFVVRRIRRRAAANPLVVAHGNPDEAHRCSCNYDLRGVADDSPCPECGALVAESKASWWLAGADERWMRYVVLGSAVVSWALVVGVLALLMFIGLFFASASETVHHLPLAARTRDAMPWAARACLFVVALGCLFLTARDPRNTSPTRMGKARITFRIAAFGAATAWIVGMVMQEWRTFLFRYDVVISTLLMAAAMFIALLSGFSWLAQLAARVPDQRLADRCLRRRRQVRWILPALCVAEIGWALLFRLTGPSTMTVPTWWTLNTINFLTTVWLAIDIALVMRSLLRRFDELRALKSVAAR